MKEPEFTIDQGAIIGKTLERVVLNTTLLTAILKKQIVIDRKLENLSTEESEINEELNFYLDQLAEVSNQKMSAIIADLYVKNE